MALSLPRVPRKSQIKSALTTLNASVVSKGGTAMTSLSSTLSRKQQGARIAQIYNNAKAKGAIGTLTVRRYPSKRRARAQLLALETIIGTF